MGRKKDDNEVDWTEIVYLYTQNVQLGKEKGQQAGKALQGAGLCLAQAHSTESKRVIIRICVMKPIATVSVSISRSFQLKDRIYCNLIRRIIFFSNGKRNVRFYKMKFTTTVSMHCHT